MLLKSVHLQNVGTYGNVELNNLHEQPLVVISGINHDSDTATSRLYFFLRQVEPASTKFGGTAAATETTPAA